MSAETLIYGTLSGAAGVIAIVSTRIYPDAVSQEITLPAIVTQRAESEYHNTIHSGVAVAKQITMESWCLAATRISAESLADAVEVALPVGGFRIVNRFTEFDPDTGTFIVVVAGAIWE